MTQEPLSLNFFVFLYLGWHEEGSMNFLFTFLALSLPTVQSVWKRTQGRSGTLLLLDEETLTLTSDLTF